MFTPRSVTRSKLLAAGNPMSTDPSTCPPGKGGYGEGRMDRDGDEGRKRQRIGMEAGTQPNAPPLPIALPITLPLVLTLPLLLAPVSLEVVPAEAPAAVPGPDTAMAVVPAPAPVTVAACVEPSSLTAPPCPLPPKEGEAPCPPGEGEPPCLTAARTGYFNGGISHVVSDRYCLMANLGKGVFASVYRCVDLNTGQEVALKILRKCTSGGRSGAVERQTLRRLHSEKSRSEPDHGRHFIVRLLDDFEYAGHACIVLERMYTSLRTLCKRTMVGATNINRTIGLQGGGMLAKIVLSFARQTLEALRHVHGLGIIHLDIKPDNLLVSQDCSHLKLCDFGTAVHIADNDPVPIQQKAYMVARFYRAPELAIAYGSLVPAVDIWSFGITIAEMISGRHIFKGKTNSELVWNHMNVLGPVPASMSETCSRKEYFGGSDAEYYNLKRVVVSAPGADPEEVLSVEAKPASTRETAAAKLLELLLPPSLQALNTGGGSGLEEGSYSAASVKEFQQVVRIRDLLLNKLLTLDPADRASAKAAINEGVVASMDHIVNHHIRTKG
jgi:serine/threonine protein kinase